MHFKSRDRTQPGPLSLLKTYLKELLIHRAVLYVAELESDETKRAVRGGR